MQSPAFYPTWPLGPFLRRIDKSGILGWRMAEGLARERQQSANEFVIVATLGLFADVCQMEVDRSNRLAKCLIIWRV